MAMTTSKRGFKVEDCTNRNVRQQSEILKEGAVLSDTHSDVEVPVSHTPEQLKNFLNELCVKSTSEKEKSAFNAIIRLIDERGALKKAEASRMIKEMQTGDEEMPTDI